MVWYATREAVKSAGAGIKGSASDAEIDLLLAGKSASLERDLDDRHFYPLIATRYYDYPSCDATANRLRLDKDLLAVTLIMDGDEEIAEANYLLRPDNESPKTAIDLINGVVFSSGLNRQKQIAITGTWGYSNDEAAAGALVGAIDESANELVVSDSSKVGIGDLLHIDNERIAVAEKSLADTTATLDGAVLADDAAVLIAVDDATKVKKGELLTIDAEKVLVVDIAGNNLIVQRAQDGSLLAAHDTATAVYAPRTLTVGRAQAGTEAAAHDDATAITRNVPPGIINELVIAEVISALEQQKAGYGRNIGQGEGAFESRGIALHQLRDEVKELYGAAYSSVVAV